MKLKDQLLLREVAGQYVIVPTGKRVKEITSIVYISSSGAYLWDYMKDHDFQPEDLVDRIMEHYDGVTREQAAADVKHLIGQLHFGRRRGARTDFCKNPQREGSAGP